MQGFTTVYTKLPFVFPAPILHRWFSSTKANFKASASTKDYSSILTMTSQITSWDDLDHVSEDYDSQTGKFQHTSFAVATDETVYTGQLIARKADISFSQVMSALSPVPDEVIFPEYPSSPDTHLTRAPEILPANVYIKRPALSMYTLYKEHNGLRSLRQGLLREAQTMQFLAEHPHPHTIRYHGCLVKGGYITGLVLDKHPSDLESYLKKGLGHIDKEPFMAALESAIYHLHSLSWAHNDINPSNILVDASGMPVLIDFDSCLEIGQGLPTRGTEGWRDVDIEEYTMSDTKHDMFALGKLRGWLDKPTFRE